MKILKLLPLACTIILGAASCSDDDKEQTGFQIDDGSGFLSLDAAARSGSIAITANNSWSVTQDKDSEWAHSLDDKRSSRQDRDRHHARGQPG